MPFSNFERTAAMIVPIHANGCGNTFLLFDYLFNSSICDMTFVRSCHEYVGYDRVDSCLILVDAQVQNQSLFLRMRISEKKLLDDMDGFCGNGARVVCHYLHKKYGSTYDRLYIRVGEQLHALTAKNGTYFVEMGPNRFVDVDKKYATCEIDDEKAYVIQGYKFYFACPSEPHLVTFDEMADEKLLELGHYAQSFCKADFPGGINLNRVQVVDEGSINNLTYERGVCRLTKACGTGSVSAAIMVRQKHYISPNVEQIQVHVPGGTLTVQFDEYGVATLGGPSRVYAYL